MSSSTAVFAQAEQEVYHALSEWPLCLVLRQRRLEAALLDSTKGTSDATTPDPDRPSAQS